MTDHILPDEDEPINSDEDYDEGYDEEPVLGTMLVEDDDSEVARKSVGLGFVVSGFVIASLLGGLIGIVIPKVFQHPGRTQELRNEMQVKIDTLSQTGNELNNKLATLTAQLQNQQDLIAKLQTKDIELTNALRQQQKNILAQSARLDTPENKDVEKNGVDNQQITNTGIDREVTLDTGAIANLPQKTSNPDGDNLAQKSLVILKETFPRQKLLAAAQAQEVLAQKKPGWLRRILRKHIKVREQTVLDPYSLIDTAEAALREGRVQDAIDAIAKLNPAVGSSAADWVQAAKKSLE